MTPRDEGRRDMENGGRGHVVEGVSRGMYPGVPTERGKVWDRRDMVEKQRRNSVWKMVSLNIIRWAVRS